MPVCAGPVPVDAGRCRPVPVPRKDRKKRCISKMRTIEVQTGNLYEDPIDEIENKDLPPYIKSLFQ